MWLRRFSSYLLQHQWQITALVFVSAFVPTLGLIGILIAAFVTLCKGAKAGGILTLAASLPYLISFGITGYHDAAVPLAVWAAVGVAVASNLLTYIFAVMLRQQSSFAVILQAAALFGVLAVSLIHLAYPNIATWWNIELQSYYAQAKGLFSSLAQKSGDTPADIQRDTINVTKMYATGLMTAAILCNAAVQLIIVRWWQAFLFKPGSLRRELRTIRLAPLAGVLFAASLVLAYLGNTVVVDIMPIVYLLFGAAGLSLIHFVFATFQSQTVWFWLILFYFALLMLLPSSLILVALCALADSWFDIRKRLTKV